MSLHERRMVFEPVALKFLAGELRAPSQAEHQFDHVFTSR